MPMELSDLRLVMLVQYIVYTYSEGIEVLVYDRLTYAGCLENLGDVLDRVWFVRGDIVNGGPLEHVLIEFDHNFVDNSVAEALVSQFY